MHARPWSRLLPAALATAVALGAATVPSTATASPGGPVAGAESVVPASPNGRYLVQYAARTDVAAEARTLRTRGVAVRRTFGTSVRAAVVSATRAQAAQLARDPQVVAVEPDVRITAAGTQGNAPWGLDRLDQRSLPLDSSYTAPAAGAGVTVYVMDTGVFAGHTDFGGRVAAGWSAIDDGYGTGDCNGHGTHVAGTVAGKVYGVAKSATIVPVRVLDCDGAGWGSDLLDGLAWIAQHHAAGTPAVLNMSLGGDEPSSVIDDAVRTVMADGVTAAVAAGNAGTDACTSSPARVADALTVAASDQYDQQASFSNVGACVDLYAPGVRIASASYASSTGYAVASGTSMATPHVAGAAAVLLAQRPDLTPIEVAAQLNADATTGAVRNASGGTPNRLLFLAASAPAPAETQPAPGPAPEDSQPTTSQPETNEPETSTPEDDVTAPARAARPKAAAKRRSARVSWVHGDDGGAAIIRQVVRVYRGKKRIAAFNVPGDVTAVRVKGLKPRKVYRFTVIEKNAYGRSPESAKSNKVRPRR